MFYVQEVQGNWILGAESAGELDFKCRKCRAGLPWSPPFKAKVNFTNKSKVHHTSFRLLGDKGMGKNKLLLTHTGISTTNKD